MKGIARPAGAGATIEWQGETFTVGSFGLEDWGLIEHHMIRHKRKRKVQIVADLIDVLPPEIWNEKFDQARAEAEKIDSLAEGEFDEFANSTEGVALILFILLDRRYPGKFRLDQMTEIIGKQITADQLADLMTAKDQAAGTDPAGEATGQNIGTSQAV